MTIADNRATPIIPDSVAVFGEATMAAAVGLRHVLKPKALSGTVIVMDYTGRGAVLLGQDRRIDITGRRVRWFDIADRRQPVALFQLRRSSFFRSILLKALDHIRKVSGKPAEDATLAWAVEAAYELSANGTVGLGALLKTISFPEVRNWFVRVRNNPDDFGHLLDMISWALRFPAVYAISEAVNSAHLGEDLKKMQIVWMECRIEHFEPREYSLVVTLLEAAVEDAVKQYHRPPAKGNPDGLTVLHLFPPPTAFESIPEWVAETSPLSKHISVHRLNENRPLSPLALSWAKQAARLWIMGGGEKLKRTLHASWLSGTDLDAIEHLKREQLWAKSADSGESVVVNIGQATDSPHPVTRLRHNDAHRRKISPVRQMASAADLLVHSPAGETDFYKRLCQIETLRLGWLRVQGGSKKTAGLDGVTVAQFKNELEVQLSKLASELSGKTYRCKALHRVYIQKPDGGQRPLGVGCVRDKVVQAACLMLIEPIFEPVFSPRSFAFRPGRNAHQALAMARSMIAGGRRNWIVIADIQKCFESIDHDVLLDQVARRVSDHDLLKLLRHWLTVDVLDFHDLFPLMSGVPQGQSLSPLLANIYLDPLDKHLEKSGLHFVRYADDIIVPTTSRQEAEKALEIMEQVLLDPLHLELKPAKTQFVPFEEGFEFLGFRIDPSGARIQQTRVDRIESMLQPKIKDLGLSNATLARRSEALLRINAMIRGFRNYFMLPCESQIRKQFALLDNRIEDMAGCFLPVEIRNDPAWVCRERFLTGKPDDMTDNESSAEIIAQTGCAYPETRTHLLPARWILENDSSESTLRGETTSQPTPTGLLCPTKDEDDNEIESVMKVNNGLYILTHGAYLTLHGDDLIVKKRKVAIARYPLHDVLFVFVQGFGITISVSLQLKLTDLDIPVVMAAPAGTPIAVLNAVVSSKASLRVRQVLRRNDSDIISAGLDMISAKVGNQAAVLRYFAKYRKRTDSRLCAELIRTAGEIRETASHIRLQDPCGASIRSMTMGTEGQAGAAYWRRLAELLPSGLSFPGRKGRGAKDPVNQCLNYVYALLYSEVWCAVARAGLDPYFGLMHGSQRDEGSLVFDLIEEFRAPFVDRLVLGLIGRGFQPEIGRNGMLKTGKRKQLVRGFLKNWTKQTHWRSKTITPAGILDFQTDNLKKLFLREGAYHPFRMRW